MPMELTEDQRARLDAEWAFLNATREMMNIARRKLDQTTYRQGIYLSEIIAPNVMGREKRILHGVRASLEARTYREKALAETALRGQLVTPLDMCSEEIQRLSEQIEAVPEAEMLKSKLEIASKVKRELMPKRVTENQIIFRDAIKTNRHLPISHFGTDSVEYSVDERRALRITVLHPDPAEHKLGADLVYEFHDIGNETARVVLLQYKMWEKNTLPYDPRMNRQLEKLMVACCKGQLCFSPEGDNRQTTYRFPYCSAFLRPTDRLQDPDATLRSSGLHIPLCIAMRSWVDSERGGKVIRRAAIQSQSPSHAIFEYLFVSSFLGSREIHVEELEKHYREWGLLEEEENIILHAQEFAREPAKGKSETS